MSAPQKNSPSCILAGEISSLAIVLSEKLKEISCNLEFIPLKISTQKKLTGRTLPPTFNSIEELGLINLKYVFYFAPESVNNNETDYLSHQNLIYKLTKDSSKNYIKTILITSHPNDFVNSAKASHSLNISNKTLDEFFKNNHSYFTQNPSYEDFKIKFLINDLISSELNKNSPTTINTLFFGLFEKIYTTKTDNHLLYPVDEKAVVNQIIKTSFSQNYSTIPYHILGNQEISLINSALIVKTQAETKTGKTSKIISIPNKKSKKIISQKIYTPPSSSPEKLIQNLTTWVLENPSIKIKPKPKAPKAPLKKTITKPRASKKNNPASFFKTNNFFKRKKSKPISTQNKASKRKPIFIIVALLLVMIIIPPILFLNYSQKTINFATNNDYQQAINYAQKANFFYKTSKPSLMVVSTFTSIFLPNKHQEVVLFKEILKEGSLIVGSTNSLLNDSQDILSHILSSQKGDVFSKLEKLTINIEKIYSQSSTIQANLNSIIELRNKRGASQEKLVFVKKKLTGIRKNLSDSIVLLNNSEEILGKNQTKTYLVLLQNNTELRATGGFIGSFALLSFDKGSLLDIETYDVYSADGQLRGHVEPPKALKEHLGEANWYLRDSNWEPDFSISARRAEWFLNKELGRQVDGTIGINLFTIKDLLDSMGEIEIPDYQETITGDNLFLRAEYFSELNYFDGSTQKKDFLSSLINAIFIKITNPDEDYGLKIIQSFFKSAVESQLQMSFRSNQVEESLSNTSFSGLINENRCNSDTPCINDYLSIIESNVGVNKVNYFIEREISHQVQIGNNNTNSITTLLLKNTAESAAWPAGTYKNYIRFLVPQNTSINKVLIGDSPVKASDLDITTKDSIKTVGFLVEVPINSQETISVHYSLNQKTPNKNSYQYDLFFEKQSGTQDDPLNIQVSTTNSNIINQSNIGNINNNNLNVSTNNNKDVEVVVNLSKN